MSYLTPLEHQLVDETVWPMVGDVHRSGPRSGPGVTYHILKSNRAKFKLIVIVSCKANKYNS